MPRLKLVSERYRGKVYELDQDKHSCGRTKDSSISIPDSTISSHHCDFVRVNGRYILKDAGSTNGSRINNIPIAEQELFHSDIIQLGGIEMLFEDETDDSRFITRTEHGIQLDNEASRSMVMTGLSRTDSSAGKANTLLIVLFALLVLAILVLGFMLFQQLAS